MEQHCVFKSIFMLVLGAIVVSCSPISDKNLVAGNTQGQTAKMSAVNSEKGVVTRDMAAIVAENFLETLEDVDFEIKTIDSIPDFDGKTSVYIFNFSPCGYVLTSNNVKTQPIMAYSLENEFPKWYGNKNIPQALIFWMAGTILFNDYVKNDESVPSSVVQSNYSGWDEYSIQAIRDKIHITDIVSPYDPCEHHPLEIIDSTRTTVGPLMTTKWGQGSPYNAHVPLDGAPAGCTAVATGQIMKFHEHPLHFFDWGIMPDVANSMNAGANEIALLLADIGRKVFMRYSLDGSGAYSIDVRNALVNNYSYSNEANYSRYGYSRVINEIANKLRPVYMDGYGYQSIKYIKKWCLLWGYYYEEYPIYDRGHAWVCDGYSGKNEHFFNPCNGAYIKKRTGFLHMNWGWSSLYNGWFSNRIIDYEPNNGTNSFYIDWDVIMQTEFPNFQYLRCCIYNIHP